MSVSPNHDSYEEFLQACLAGHPAAVDELATLPVDHPLVVWLMERSLAGDTKENRDASRAIYRLPYHAPLCQAWLARLEPDFQEIRDECASSVATVAKDRLGRFPGMAEEFLNEFWSVFRRQGWVLNFSHKPREYLLGTVRNRAVSFYNKHQKPWMKMDGLDKDLPEPPHEFRFASPLWDYLERRLFLGELPAADALLYILSALEIAGPTEVAQQPGLTWGDLYHQLVREAPELPARTRDTLRQLLMQHPGLHAEVGNVARPLQGRVDEARKLLRFRPFVNLDDAERRAAEIERNVREQLKREVAFLQTSTLAPERLLLWAWSNIMKSPAASTWLAGQAAAELEQRLGKLLPGIALTGLTPLSRPNPQRTLDELEQSLPEGTTRKVQAAFQKWSKSSKEVRIDE